MLIMLFIAVPLTIIQSLQQQETRQRAGLEAAVTLKAWSNSSSYFTGETFDVYVDLENPNQKDISAVDVNLSYDKDALELVNFNTASSQFSVIAPENLQQATTPIHFVGIRTDTDTTTSGISPIFHIGVLTFKAKQETTGAQNSLISFSDLKITASESEDNLSFSSPESQTYSITSRGTAAAGNCIEKCMIDMGAGSSDDATIKNLCSKQCSITPTSSSPSQSSPSTPTSNALKCTTANFSAICTTPPYGDKSCWLPFCNIAGANEAGTCDYQLNPLLNNDQNPSCKSLWQITPTPTPTPTPVQTPKEQGACSIETNDTSNPPSCQKLSASSGCKLGFTSIDDCRGRQNQVLCSSDGGSEPTHCALAQPK